MISTTKYSLLTWLPISLLEQFRRVANVYFLAISILMLIGTYAPTLYSTPLNPYSTLATLVFVMMVTSIKEGVEDVARARSDYEENNREVTVIEFDENGKCKEITKSNQLLKSGDIVKLNGQTPVPADLLLVLPLPIPASNYSLNPNPLNPKNRY